ncbi:TetR/AcrR family transcriptional regulator [uncultured Secundilactobacillus sp.]|uniref:TetR/AcrR family transcriptional regulator n=1 Tax=uncultured Secundilactobacillus sp. TaxID=2813935 RepID=UPI0025905EAF|nr:TetR/AcrR family transcriptional regulator [uncultured Secundilactobacillus sp.]
MKQEADPRVIKTKQNLRAALIALMADHRLDDISVQQLTQQAHVTRGAFYLHYKNKSDFIDRTFVEIEHEFFSWVVVSANDNNGEWEFEEDGNFDLFSLNRAFDYFAEHQQLFMVLFQGEARNAFMAVVFNRMAELLTHFQDTSRQFNRETYVDEVNVPVEIAQSYIIYALLGVIQQWLQDGVKYTPHYMTQCCDTLNGMFSKKFTYVDFFVVTE